MNKPFSSEPSLHFRFQAASEPLQRFQSIKYAIRQSQRQPENERSEFQRS
ncbi:MULTISPECIES: hypothetical protein [Kingella]|uniref:Uncharacterized protein n=1 Tax=Kingella bonacorsii TaxID=2796361 RepID=A0ABS1BTE3_9NEIS|nr:MULTISPECIES: hypothetical protein [Kingella]MBK0396560.1 hypothetical protein [Kingella bonacorsii]QMT42830.1 hypothetical protein H3L93_00110 [Kingella oralis]